MNYLFAIRRSVVKQLKMLGLMISVTLVWSALQAQDFPEMIVVQGGSFMMGDDTGDQDEKPAHAVVLKTYRIAKTETTVGQWREFCVATGRKMPEVPWFGQEEDHPIVNVSWDQVVAYCQWLNETAGKHYRLPSEAEWEFAARGGVKSKGYNYSGAKTPDSVAWFSSKSTGPMGVAKKLPNELGLYDMTGNVWEWCSDWYDPGYYSVSPKQDPKGPAKGMFYTLRGGAWDQGARNNRLTYRNPLSPSSRNHNKGFRVATSDQ
jgi:formylglycine-generating enzyme required for sulfatase activity